MKNFKKIIICAIVFCQNCSTYNTPQVKINNTWSSKQSITNIDLSYIAWWHSFNDSQLNSLIAKALYNNNEIQQAVGNIITAQGALQQIDGSFIPNVNLQLGYVNSNNATLNGYSLGLVPNYTLNILQQYRLRQGAVANLFTAKYTKDAVKLTIISQVAGSYFTLLAQKSKLLLQQELVEFLAQNLAIGESGYNNGYISLLAVQNLRQQYYDARIQINIIENNIFQAQNALKVLTNQATINLSIKTDFITLNTTKIIPINLPAKVLNSRPEILKAEQNLIAANANIAAARANFFPAINLTSSLGYASNALTGLFNSTNNVWNVNVQSIIPIINFSNFGKIRSAKGQYYTAYYNYIDVVRKAFFDVENNLFNYQKLTQNYIEGQNIYNSAKLAMAISSSSYALGASSQIQNLAKQIDYQNAVLRLIDLKSSQILALVKLYQALAGGYNVRDITKKKFNDSHDA